MANRAPRRVAGKLKLKAVDNRVTGIISYAGKEERRMVMNRFDWIYRAEVSPPQEWDRDLTPKSDFAALPSLGSLVPNWLLFMPRQPAINLASLKSSERVRLLDHARGTMRKTFGETASRSVAYFEHGASRAKAANGCGVDHAHLHAVILPFNLGNIFREENLEVRPVSSYDPWAEVAADDYLLYMDEDVALYSPVKTPVSQYFRKMIAENIGCANKWDYKNYPFQENIEVTLRNFHAAG